MRANVEILEFLPFWGGGSWWVTATSFRVGTADWSPVHWSRAGDGGADRPWRGGEHTDRRREVGDRNEKQQRGLEQKIRREQKLLFGSLGCTTALFCAVTLVAVPSSAPCAWLGIQHMWGMVAQRELLSQSAGGTPWRGQGLGDVELVGHTSAGPGSAAVQAFTSACRAVEPFCANGTGGECRIKSWALLSSHHDSE